MLFYTLKNMKYKSINDIEITKIKKNLDTIIERIAPTNTFLKRPSLSSICLFLMASQSTSFDSTAMYFNK